MINMESPYKALERENERLRDEIRSLKQALNEDSFTMSYNRKFFMESLEGLCKNSDEPFAIAFIDVDGLKSVNDRHGHAAGDEILLQAAHMLHAAIDDDDILARMGGDEFAIIIHNIGDASRLSIAENMMKKIHSIDFQINSQQFSIGVSVGVAIGGKNSVAAEILSQADQYMYQNKSLKSSDR